MSGAEVCAGAAAWVLSSFEIRTRVCVNDVSPVPFPLSSPSTILNLSPFPGSFFSPSPHPMGHGVTSHGDGASLGAPAVRGAGRRDPRAHQPLCFQARGGGPGWGGLLCELVRVSSSVSQSELSPPGLWPEPRAFHFRGGRNPAPDARPSAGEVRTSARRWAPMRPGWEAKNLRDPVGARADVCVSEAKRERESENRGLFQQL